MVFTDGEVQAFRLYNDDVLSGPCPSCAAVERRRVTRHDVGCAYLAWELAEDRAWMEY